MSEDKILATLRQHLVGRSIRNIEFYLIENEELMPLGEGSLYTDGGVVFRFDNDTFFTFGWDVEKELVNYWTSLPTGESEIELPEMSEETVPSHLRAKIKDIEVIWETIEETIENGSMNGNVVSYTLPIMVILTLEDETRFAVASLTVEEDGEEEGPLVGLDIEGMSALILEEDLIDFILENDDSEDDGGE
jgi:hypothetical protein